jgi:hypothetical protein
MTNELIGKILLSVKKSEQSKATPLDRTNRIYAISQQVADYLRAEELDQPGAEILSGFVLQMATESIMLLQSL